MGLANWFRKSTSPQQMIAWGVEVARGCHAGVTLRLHEAMYAMSMAEARGYIRARSAMIVALEVQSLQQRTQFRPAVAEIIRQRATEEVIRMAMGDLVKATRKSPPVRKAA